MTTKNVRGFDPEVKLAKLLEDTHGDWNACQRAKDLLDWFNRSKPTRPDLERLAQLDADFKFRAWGCPTCGERVFEGEPDNWGDFQGVLQNDRASYPGNGGQDMRCDHCRMTMAGEDN